MGADKARATGNQDCLAHIILSPKQVEYALRRVAVGNTQESDLCRLFCGISLRSRSPAQPCRGSPGGRSPAQPRERRSVLCLEDPFTCRSNGGCSAAEMKELRRCKRLEARSGPVAAFVRRLTRTKRMRHDTVRASPATKMSIQRGSALWPPRGRALWVA